MREGGSRITGSPERRANGTAGGAAGKLESESARQPPGFDSPGPTSLTTKQTTMEKYIAVTKEDREFLARTFKVSDRTVAYALQYDGERGNTATAKRIRKAAMERGGVAMVAAPEVETMHDHDGYMRQYLPNGAMLEFNKVDDSGDVWFKGERVRHHDSVRISDIEGIQRWATTLR